MLIILFQERVIEKEKKGGEASGESGKGSGVVGKVVKAVLSKGARIGTKRKVYITKGKYMGDDEDSSEMEDAYERERKKRAKVM